jgi:hypothetical protein
MIPELDDYLFDLRGYLILKNAVDAELVGMLNKALDEFPELPWQGWHGNVQRFDNNGHAGVELQNIVEAGEPFERLIDYPTYLPYLRHYCGEEDSYVQGLFIDECFASIRRSGGYFPIHSGGHYGTVRNQYRFAHGKFRCGQVNMLLALTNIGPGDGGTMIIPGSHKSNLPHPVFKDPDYYDKQMDNVEGVVEVHMKAGDVLLFVDALSHGASSRTNPGERRAVIYRYGVSWGNTRHGYRYSEELLARLTPERRKILQPVSLRIPERQAVGV